jgi:hypothetical protein
MTETLAANFAVIEIFPLLHFLPCPYDLTLHLTSLFDGARRAQVTELAIGSS